MLKALYEVVSKAGKIMGDASQKAVLDIIENPSADEDGKRASGNLYGSEADSTRPSARDLREAIRCNAESSITRCSEQQLQVC